MTDRILFNDLLLARSVLSNLFKSPAHETSELHHFRKKAD